MTAPATDRPPLSAAWLHAASVTMSRAADDVEAGDVANALERLNAAVAIAESARAELRTHRRRHTVAGAMADAIRDHLKEDRR